MCLLSYYVCVLLSSIDDAADALPRHGNVLPACMPMMVPLCRMVLFFVLIISTAPTPTPVAAADAPSAAAVAAAIVGAPSVGSCCSGEKPVEPQAVDRTLFRRGHSSLDASTQTVSSN